MIDEIDLIGVYEVDGQKDVHLIELGIKTNHENIDLGQFTQTQDGIDRMEWQSPWDEKFLSKDGTKIIGDWMDSPTDTSDFTRLAFFLHFIAFDNPLVTPFGEMVLSNPEKMPTRISSLIEYEKPK